MHRVFSWRTRQWSLLSLLILMVLSLLLLRGGEASALPAELPLSNSSGSITLTALEDSFVAEGAPTTNYGAQDVLVVSRDEFLQESLSLVWFNIALIPSYYVIQSATLRLSLVDASGPASVPVNLFRVTEPWEESTVTWNNRPSLSFQVGSSNVGNSAGNVTWNVTALVQQWHAGGYQNHGLALRGPENGSYHRSFESLSGESAPVLVIQYSVAPTTTATATPTTPVAPTATHAPTAVADLTVPGSDKPVQVDGECTSAEYRDAVRVAFEEGSDHPVAYLHHGANDLFLCAGYFGPDRPVGVAIDRDGSRDALAQEDDYRFLVERDGTTIVEQGDGAGAFVPLDDLPGSWEAATRTGLDFIWWAEFRISREALGMPSDWSQVIGLSLVQVEATAPPANDDLIWPPGAAANAPSTWARTRFADLGAEEHEFTFEGHVRDPAGDGIAGVTVQLDADWLEGPEEVTTTSDSGFYELTYTYRGTPPERFVVQEIDPRGAYSISANAGPDGTASNPNVLLYYPGEGTTHNSYTGAEFIDAFGAPPAAAMARHYLILYSEPVRERDFAALVEMKQMQGYRVEMVSKQQLEESGSGQDLPEKMRNWLKEKWEQYEPAPLYVLIVGRGDVFPLRDVGGNGDRSMPMGAPGYQPLVRTDWYFADLDSEWNLDGDPFFGEYLFCYEDASYDTNPDPEEEDLLPCPAFNSPLREGPFGQSASITDDWIPEIAVGRLGVNDPEEVRTAIAAIVAAERSASLAKRTAMLAGAFWNTESRKWDEEAGEYVNGSPGWDGTRPYGDDTAEHLDGVLKPMIEPYLDDVVTLYESTTPGPPAQSPTRKTPDFPLSLANVFDRWENQGIGLVNFAGHGSPDLIQSYPWRAEHDQAGVINNPADPASCTEPPCWELRVDSVANKWLPEPQDVPPVVFAYACGTGEIGWTEGGGVPPTPGRVGMPSILAARGHIAAWVGGLSVVPTHGLEPLQDAFNRDILSTPHTLGDSLWRAATGMIGRQASRPFPLRDGRSTRHTPYAWLTDMAFFGDPAATYWGNPVDAAAYWPQDGQNWQASSAARHSGPSRGIEIWRLSGIDSPTAVDRRGWIFAGAGDEVLRIAPDGTILDRGSIGEPGTIAFAPALGTGGLYVVTPSRPRLYLMDYDLNLLDAIDLPASPNGPARVDPGGAVYVPTSRGLVRVVGAGRPEVLLYHEPVTANQWVHGSSAISPSGAILWSTTAGNLHGYRMGRFRPLALSPEGTTDALGQGVSPPAIGQDGSVYVTTRDGKVHRRTLMDETPATTWSFDTGYSIVARPAVDGNMVFAGNQAGRVVALSATDGSLIWSRTLSGIIYTSPSTDASRVYVVGDHIYALDKATGEVLWRVDPPWQGGEQSTVVIGANRTIYVTVDQETLVAIGERQWLDIPTITETIPGIEELTIRWRDNSTGESGFRIDRCAWSGECEEVGTVDANVTSFTLQSVTPGVPWRFRLQATGESDMGESTGARGTGAIDSDFVYSDLIMALPAVPGAPTAPTATARSSFAIEVTWRYPASGTAAGFDIFRSRSANGTYEQIGATDSSARAFLDEMAVTPPELEAGVTYFYRVRARNESGASALTSPVSATTFPHELDAPSPLAATFDGASVRLAWQDNSDEESSYVVERRFSGLAGYEVLATLPAGATTYTDEEAVALDLAGTFYYRVKAVAEGMESPYAHATTGLPPGRAPDLFLPVFHGR